MIKYNWEKIKILCKYDVTAILQYFCFTQKIYIPPYLPKNFSRLVYRSAKKPIPNGYSYLLDINSLLLNRDNAHIMEIYEYIDLASMRSLFDYKVRNVKTLPAIFAENEIDNILLTVDNKQIYFKYE